MDFIVNDAGEPWLIEVNPRLTGSVEILELACGMQLLADHVACYDSGAASFAREFAASPSPPRDERLGRAILYAPYRLISKIPLPQPVVWNTAPPIADIPEPGTVIEAGRPVCSVYAWGTNIDDVTAKLFAAARDVEQYLERVDEA
jgi:predicted ATP-grasp superfamily ATP-dependent carboligase